MDRPGPLGQSITAIGLLGHAAAAALPADDAAALRTLILLYGVPVWGFAIIWLAIAALITLRTARRSLPFSLTWWSFTFPVGTVVTGTSQLALHTDASFLTDASVALYALLIAAWLTAATRTIHGAFRGRLFLSPPATATIRRGTA